MILALPFSAYLQGIETGIAIYYWLHHIRFNNKFIKNIKVLLSRLGKGITLI